MLAFSPRYDAALKLAARAHRDQVRKGTDVPYIAHVAHVSAILLRHGFDEDLAIAGLLHDIVEDCAVPLADIGKEFGERVARMVEAVSEQKRADGVPLPWEQRTTTRARSAPICGRMVRPFGCGSSAALSRHRAIIARSKKACAAGSASIRSPANWPPRSRNWQRWQVQGGE